MTGQDPDLRSEAAQMNEHEHGAEVQGRRILQDEALTVEPNRSHAASRRRAAGGSRAGGGRPG